MTIQSVKRKPHVMTLVASSTDAYVLEELINTFIDTRATLHYESWIVRSVFTTSSGLVALMQLDPTVLVYNPSNDNNKGE